MTSSASYETERLMGRSTINSPQQVKSGCGLFCFVYVVGIQVHTFVKAGGILD